MLVIVDNATVNYNFHICLTSFSKYVSFYTKSIKISPRGTLITVNLQKSIIHVQGSIGMTVIDQYIRQLIKRFQFLIMTMKRLGKVFMSLPQSLNVIDCALVHTANIQHIQYSIIIIFL